MAKAIDLTGVRSGSLVVQYELPGIRSPNGACVRMWMCKCDCGKSKAVRGIHIANGATISCGCFFHGHTRQNGKPSRTYHSWVSMTSRCNDLKNPFWHRYGGSGITICSRWEKFKNFLQDMGERPEGTTLDRFPDKKGNYEPGNCRWATPKEQSRNSVTNVVVYWKNKNMCLSELAETAKVSYSAVKQDYERHGIEHLMTRIEKGLFKRRKNTRPI